MYLAAQKIPFNFYKTNFYSNTQPISVWINSQQVAMVESERNDERYAIVSAKDSDLRLSIEAVNDLTSAEDESKGNEIPEPTLDSFSNSTKPMANPKRRFFHSKNSQGNQIDLEEKKNIAISGQTFEKQNNERRLIESRGVALQTFMREMHQISMTLNIKNFSCELSSTKGCIGIPDGLKDHIYKRWTDLQMLKVEEKLQFGNKEGVFFYETSTVN